MAKGNDKTAVVGKLNIKPNLNIVKSAKAKNVMTAATTNHINKQKNGETKVGDGLRLDTMTNRVGTNYLLPKTAKK